MLNIKCPKCGSEKVQLSDTTKSHKGCLFALIFGIYYAIVVMVKWIIGMMIFICYDWWMSIVKSIQKKGHIWISKKFFTSKRKYYYCHDCGYNFKA